MTGDVGGTQPGLGSSLPLGMCTVDGAAFYTDVGAARRLIARGANPGHFKGAVRVAALGRLGETGDHEIAGREAK